ncbi:hypothetical protein ACFSJY_17210 [Thalassotalea euphylliae]|uniref:hypothetical protein n=1 Tax=Thalassotalea euphylliae TaxID=1655234 RepID=UPI00363CADA8
MARIKTTELDILEQWVEVLLTSYQCQPQTQTARYIAYYIQRILADDDCQLGSTKCCTYSSMLRYWQLAASC